MKITGKKRSFDMNLKRMCSGLGRHLCCTPKFALPYSSKFWQASSRFAQVSSRVAQSNHPPKLVQIRVLTVQFWAECLETWYEDTWTYLWACETRLGLWTLHFLDQYTNPSFDCIGGSLTGQPLGNFEAWLGNFLKNMGGQILGYNTTPPFCVFHIFINFFL